MSHIVTLPFRPHGVRVPCALIFSALIAAVSALPAHAQPSFGKSFTPDTIAVGSTSALTFTITASSAVTDLAFTDVLPAGLEFASPASPTLGQGCNAGTFVTDVDDDPTLDGDTALHFFSDRLGAGQTCTVRVDVTGASAGIYTNVSGDLTSSAGNSGTASDDLTLSTNVPGFSKTFSPDSLSPGDVTRLTFSFNNTGGGNVFNLTFTDFFPEGLEVAAAPDVSNTCQAGGVFNVSPGATSISLFGQFLAAGATCELGLNVLVTARGTFDNRTSDASSNVGNSGFAVDRVTAALDPVGLIKSFNDPVPPGGTTDLVFTLTNSTRNSVADIAFTDDLEATLSGLQVTGTVPATPCGVGSSISGSSVLSLSGGTLASGESCSFSVEVAVPAGATPGAYPNTTSPVTSSAGTFSPASDDLDVGYAPVLVKEFCEQVVSTADPCVAVEQVTGGEILTTRFTVSNPDPANAVSELAFEDDFTAFLAGTSADPNIQSDVCGSGSAFFDSNGGSAGETYSLADGSVGAGGSCTFQVDVQLSSTIPPGTYINKTTPVIGNFGSGQVIGNRGHDQLTRSVAPELTKTFVDPVGPGDTVDLVFTLSAGESPLPFSDIAFIDDLDATLSGLGVLASPPSPCGGALAAAGGGSSLSLSGASLAVGETCSFSLTLQVPAAAAPGSYPSTTSPVTATADGEAVMGNPATDELDITFIDFTKGFIDDPTLAGGSVTLRFRIDNMGTEPMDGLSFNDDLDAVLTGLVPIDMPQSDICGAGSALTFSGGVLTLTGGTLATGESCEFSTVLQVPAMASPGAYPNLTSDLSGNVGGSPFSVRGAGDTMELQIEDLVFFDAFEDK